MVFKDEGIHEDEKQGDHLHSNMSVYYFLRTSEMREPSPLLP